MNIAIIVRRLNVRGGTQRAAVCLAQEFKSKGNRVTLYTFSYSKEDCYPELLKDFTVVEADQGIVHAMMQAAAKRGILALMRNYLYQNRAARDLARKISADTEVLNPHDQLAERVARYFKTNVKSVPAVWVVNDVSTKKTTLLREKQFNPSLRASLLKWIAYWCIDAYEYYSFVRFQDIIAVLDSRDKRWAEEQYKGVESMVVRNGLDIKEFSYSPHSGIQGKRIRLLCVAILLPHRRFEDAISAVSLLREKGYETSLSIIGEPADKSYYAALQSLALELQLKEQVQFRGRVSYEELLAAYASADIFIFPCHLQSWGLAVFEAMASGLPAVVSETAGASEVLTDGENAMIVPPYSPESIAAAVEKLADPVLYERMSKKGRAFVEANISWERYADSLLQLFDEARKKYRL